MADWDFPEVLSGFLSGCFFFYDKGKPLKGYQ